MSSSAPTLRRITVLSGGVGGARFLQGLLNGLRSGVTKAIRNYIETHNLTPRGVTLAVEDIREGVIGVLSVFVEEPQFQGQTKDRLIRQRT